MVPTLLPHEVLHALAMAGPEQVGVETGKLLPRKNKINLCCGLKSFVYVAASFRSLCLGDAVLQLCKNFGIIASTSDIGKTTLRFLDKIPQETVLYSAFCFSSQHH